MPSSHLSPVARSLLCGLVALAGLLGAFTAQAGAATSFSHVGAFAESGPDGGLHHIRKLAVEHSTGNLLVVRGGDVTVYRPTPTGAGYLTAFGNLDNELDGPHGIAIDQADGDVFVSDPLTNQIQRYATDGRPIPIYSRVSYSSPAAGAGPGEIGDFAASLAVDPTTGDLLVADPGDDLIQRYSSAGQFLGSFDGTGSPSTFTGLQDLAVDSTGDVIVVDSDGGDPADGAVSRVERFSSAGVWEETIGPVPGAANVAVRPFNDELVISGNQDAVNRDETPTLFVYDSSSNAQLTFPANVAYSTVAGIAVNDGPAGKLYVTTDTSRGLYPGVYGLVSVQIFGPPAPPEASASVSGVTPWRASLAGTVVPNNLETTYYFEYGETDAYGTQTAPMSAGAAGSPVQVSEEVLGLEPSTTYHFRIVAENALGLVPGPDQTFTTGDRAAEVSIDSVTAVGASAATVNATVNTHGHAGTYRFYVVADDGSHKWSSGVSDLAATEDFRQVSAALSGLAPGTAYTARIEVTTSGGIVTTGRLRFSTASPQPPAFASPVAAVVPDFAAAPATSPPSRFAVGVGKGAALRVTVPGRGVVSIRGKGVRTVTKRPSAAGTTTVRLRLSKAGKRRLANSRSGKLRRKVTISYRPAGGSERSVTRSVTFKR